MNVSILRSSCARWHSLLRALVTGYKRFTFRAAVPVMMWGGMVRKIHYWQCGMAVKFGMCWTGGGVTSYIFPSYHWWTIADALLSLAPSTPLTFQLKGSLIAGYGSLQDLFTRMLCLGLTSIQLRICWLLLGRIVLNLFTLWSFLNFRVWRVILTKNTSPILM